MKYSKRQQIDFLKTRDADVIEEVFEEARAARKKYFGNKVFMSGFVYFTTWCKNDCTFCYYRASNKIERYRKKTEEVLDYSKKLAESGVHMIDLTMGEDLFHYNDGFESVAKLIREIKKETGLPIMVSPGVIRNDCIEKLAKAGADWYALYQETHNKELFSKLRINQNYDNRMAAKVYARECGMLIEEGIMTGVGEDYQDIVDSIEEMERIKASQIRVMSFVPQKGSPMENVRTPERMLELKIIALMRINFPWALIPTSLDIDGIAGLKPRLDAGGNIVTSIIPPKTGLAGVAQNSMDVDDGGRTVKEVTTILSDVGMEPATAEEYRDYIGDLNLKWRR